MDHSTLATLAVSASRAMMALGLSLSACSDDTAEDCDLAALIPDLANVPSGPRENEIAETLALERSEGVAASPELYASLASDLEAIFAVDPRMRLEGDSELQLYPFHHELADPAVLGAYGEEVDAARSVLEPGCGRTVTAALGGAAALQEGSIGDRIFVGFPARLHDDHLVALYASIGIPLTPAQLVGGGSSVAYRDLELGREFLFDLRGGDCPVGCTFSRTFWWRVTSGSATLIDEWGHDLEAPYGGTFTPAPEGFDRTGFSAPSP